MADEVGILLSNGCRITHGRGANVKSPFPKMMPGLVMHELSPSNTQGFKGQLGFIEFDTEMRLPRHIHIDPSKQRLVDERIMVLHGVGRVELTGEIFAVAPGSLVDAVGGVPHTWTACPAGVRLSNGTVSTGTFTMVYEYEEPTSFFPTVSTERISHVSQYQAYSGDLEEIRFPRLSAEQVVAKARTILNHAAGGLEVA
ncbi:hypothetical protein BAUCODRAFT_477768 [Baudoinia panamericana UAMH 10762]|uniref:Uncharacterized protein n=1 Tax=Baudoinia panamericana (strain UAMH 10762) TaxID=717646 RepID=M2NCB6_BAUPA|nr:uncharacterized protein BAUCODRAFT_477768 [Baudoinia panamericana UAMH 10762]EMC96515.1 hypothetical protein BAUCODRAFT_477768 [Baudoinia panamericana UAMH 10762]